MHSDQQMGEQNQIDRIRSGDIQAFENLFYTCYYPLCSFSYKITGCSEAARDAVQEVFMKIWNTRTGWYIKLSVKAYLFRAVRNQSLKLKESQQAHQQLKNSEMEIMYFQELENLLTEKKLSLHSSRLTAEIWNIAEKMPEKRRQTFELHRKHGLSYSKIADVMNNYRKTVENHLARALQEIREKLDCLAEFRIKE